MAKVRVHLLITGRVQGVFFRASTHEEAQRHRLTGWVKNLHDGRVEAVFEGDEEDVTPMVAWCQHGPPHAAVKDLSVTVEVYRGEYTGFEVR